MSDTYDRYIESMRSEGLLDEDECPKCGTPIYLECGCAERERAENGRNRTVHPFTTEEDE